MRGTRVKPFVVAMLLALPASASAQVPFWDYVAQQAAPLIAGGGSSGRVLFNLLVDPGPPGLFNTPIVVLEWFTTENSPNGEREFVYCVKGALPVNPAVDCASGAHINGTWSPTAGITTTLPEPATMALLASGLSALAAASLLRRRGRKLRP